MQLNILRNIIEWLNKPFPFFETFKEKIAVPFYIGISVMLILILFNPSRNFDHFDIQMLKIFAYAFIAFGVSFIFNAALPIIFSQFFDIDRWCIWKTIVFTLGKFLTIGAINAVFAFYFDNPSGNIHFVSFLFSILYHTFIVAFIPVVLFIFWLEKRFYKKHYQIALKADKELHEHFNVVSSNTNFEHDGLTVPLNSIYYVKSDGNYSSIFFEKDNTISKTLLRITLKEIEEKVATKNILVRCHKSYIVNLQKVIKVEGNARRYNFYLDKLNDAIPVSRSLSKSIIEELNSLL
jgi:hypothetical protein